MDLAFRPEDKAYLGEKKVIISKVVIAGKSVVYHTECGEVVTADKLSKTAPYKTFKKSYKKESKEE